MIENIKVLLGDSASNYTDAQITLFYEMTIGEVEAYCNRKLDADLVVVAQRLTAIKLLRIGTEGLTNQSFSGVSETYIDGYPADILAIMNRKRKVKVL